MSSARGPTPPAAVPSSYRGGRARAELVGSWLGPSLTNHLTMRGRPSR